MKYVESYLNNLPTQASSLFKAVILQYREN